MPVHTKDNIPPDTAKTLPGLFRERLRRTPDAIAYRDFNFDANQWQDISWQQTASEVARWQAAIQKENLSKGECIAIMLRNCKHWVMFDQAALALGLVVVPLYTDDRAENIAYILEDAEIKILLIEGEEQWTELCKIKPQLDRLTRILSVKKINAAEKNLACLQDWLPQNNSELINVNCDPQDLATLVYTSGTTGRPKGVMLSHRNILTNAYSTLMAIQGYREDCFLSFLPLSHMFERTAGYYLSVMSGVCMAFARDIKLLADDLQTIKPTLLNSVPRIYERVYSKIMSQLEEKSGLARGLFNLTVKIGWSRFERQQKRGSWRISHLLWPILDLLVAKKVRTRMGGSLRLSFSGGAALPPDVSKVFIGLGINILQGYGLTETSPVVAANRADNNYPDSIGPAVPGVQVKLNDQGVLMVKGENVMLGYWKNAEATATLIDNERWLNTGDLAKISETGHIYIVGRTKDIIVLSNGEKIPPGDMESAIIRDPLFEQVMIVGEAKPYLAALVVINQKSWQRDHADMKLQSHEAEKVVLEKIHALVKDFPGYAKINRVALLEDAWTVDNGLLTATQKIRRNKIAEHYQKEIVELYKGH